MKPKPLAFLTDMKTKHTPGPWRYNGKTDVYNANGATICELYKGYQSIPECRANAHLIAAAPDLLEAMEGLLAWEPRQKDHAERLAWEDALAAIAKAKGETP